MASPTCDMPIFIPEQYISSSEDEEEMFESENQKENKEIKSKKSKVSGKPAKDTGRKSPSKKKLQKREETEDEMMERLAKEYKSVNPEKISKSRKASGKYKKGKRPGKSPSPTNNNTIDSSITLLCNLRAADQRPSLNFKDLESAEYCYQHTYSSLSNRVNALKTLYKLEVLTFTQEQCDIMWNTTADKFCETYVDNLEGLTNSKYYYRFLCDYVTECCLETSLHLKRSGILKHAHPAEKEPMVICCLQEGVVDFLPNRKFLVPLHCLIEEGFAPSNTLTFNPYKMKFVCGVLFWSIHHKLSLFGCMYDCGDGIKYHWECYDRKNQDINNILQIRSPGLTLV